MSTKQTESTLSKVAAWVMGLLIAFLVCVFVATTGPGDIIHPFGPSVERMQVSAKQSVKELLEQNSILLGTDEVTVKSVVLRKVSSHKFVGMAEVEYHNLFGKNMHSTLPIKVETYGDTSYTSLDLFGDRD